MWRYYDNILYFGIATYVLSSLFDLDFEHVEYHIYTTKVQTFRNITTLKKHLPSKHRSKLLQVKCKLERKWYNNDLINLYMIKQLKLNSFCRGLKSDGYILIQYFTVHHIICVFKDIVDISRFCVVPAQTSSSSQLSFWTAGRICFQNSRDCLAEITFWSVFPFVNFNDALCVHLVQFVFGQVINDACSISISKNIDGGSDSIPKNYQYKYKLAFISNWYLLGQSHFNNI